MRALAIVMVLAGAARADTLALATGQIGVDVSTAMQVDRDHVLETITLAPDLWIGVGHAVTLGIVHSDANLDRIKAESSICVRREIRDYPGVCDRAYHSTGLDLRWAVRPGIAPRVRLLLRGVDPYKPAATIGAMLRWAHGRYAIYADPYLRFGLANTNAGNRTTVVLPVFLELQLGRTQLAFHTGYDSDLAVATDGFHVPAALRVRYAVDDHVDLSIEGGFSTALGPQNSSSYRAIIAMFSWRS